GLWDILVQPPAPLPPYRPSSPLSTAAPQLNLTLPSVNSLVHVQNALLIVDGGPIPGADVTAVDSAGTPLSAPSLSQADGGFSLLLPPGTSGYYLPVGPPPADSNGAYSLTLRAGDYAVEAAPPATVDAPAVSPESAVVLSAAAPTTLNLICPPKVRGFGLIIRSDGAPVGANYQITATRLADKLLTTRAAFSIPTTADGIWHITADPGRYRVEIVPTADSGLPRKIVQLDLPGGTG